MTTTGEARANYRAYIGVAAKNGLRALEREEAALLALRQPLALQASLSFWAVLPESDARRATLLLRHGLRQAALRLIEGSARELGALHFPHCRD